MRRMLMGFVLLCSALAWSSVAAQPTVSDRETEAETLISAQDRLEALRAQAPEMKVVWRAGGEVPTLITGLAVEVSGETPQAQADAFLAEWSGVMGLTPGSLVYAETRSMTGRHSVDYQQVHDGLAVYGRRVVVTLNDEGVVTLLASDAIPVARALQGGVSEAEARSAAIEAVHGEGADAGKLLTQAQRIIVADQSAAVVAWKVGVPGNGPLDARVVLIDSRDARVLQVRRNVMH